MVLDQVQPVHQAFALRHTFFLKADTTVPAKGPIIAEEAEPRREEAMTLDVCHIVCIYFSRSIQSAYSHLYLIKLQKQTRRLFDTLTSLRVKIFFFPTQGICAYKIQPIRRH